MYHLALNYGGCVLAAFTMFYSVAACLAPRRSGEGRRHPPHDGAPVTILKPLCGAEEETYACLRSFCDQHYPRFQIVFGVADATDPAVAIVERLQREYPQVDLQLSIDRRQHGSNRKVCNLINMMPRAQHGIIVLADSDVCVERDYLSRIIGPLADTRVGIVTCTYRGIPRSGVWSFLGALFINDWFMPSVHVAAAIGSRAFASGATIALRRDVLAAVGGFKSLAGHLADDHRLGELTRRAGYRTVLSDVIVDTVVAESTLGQLVRHELRWLRTIRAVDPRAYRFLFLTFSLPIGALGSLLAAGSLVTLGMCAATTVARATLYRKTCRPGSPFAHLLLLPVRDLLSLGLWAWSFVTRRVQWRDAHFDVARDGSLRAIEGV